MASSNIEMTLFACDFLTDLRFVTVLQNISHKNCIDVSTIFSGFWLVTVKILIFMKGSNNVLATILLHFVSKSLKSASNRALKLTISTRIWALSLFFSIVHFSTNFSSFWVAKVFSPSFTHYWCCKTFPYFGWVSWINQKKFPLFFSD